jgi:hypothetical protein
LLKKDFKNIDSYYQATWKYVAVGSENVMRAEGDINIPTVSYAPSEPGRYLYFYLLCSNRKITEKIKPIAALGEHYSDRQILGTLGKAQEKIKELEEKTHNLEEDLDRIKNSKSYKFARSLSAAKSKVSTPKHR